MERLFETAVVPFRVLLFAVAAGVVQFHAQLGCQGNIARICAACAVDCRRSAGVLQQRRSSPFLQLDDDLVGSVSHFCRNRMCRIADLDEAGSVE